MKTNQLTGLALDWAVAKAEGLPVDADGYIPPAGLIRGRSAVVPISYSPSTNWAHGGPIIEREMIDIRCMPSKTGQHIWRGWHSDGDTALIAAMRSFVALKLGDDVQIPNELQEKVTA
jgi:hypothetical protein